MTMLQNDMSKVSEGDLMPKGWYHCRISKVQQEDESGQPLLSKSSSKPCIKVSFKVQSEGDNFGRQFSDTVSLESNALFKLKALYTAVGYAPGVEGHDPQRLLDGEVWLFINPSTYQGNPTLDIKPYTIRSVQEGPGAADGSVPRAAARK